MVRADIMLNDNRLHKCDYICISEIILLLSFSKTSDKGALLSSGVGRKCCQLRSKRFYHFFLLKLVYVLLKRVPKSELFSRR